MQTVSELSQEIANDAIYSSFIKLLNKEQNGENDYTKGAIQAVNALSPAISKLVALALSLEDKMNNLPGK